MLHLTVLRCCRFGSCFASKQCAILQGFMVASTLLLQVASGLADSSQQLLVWGDTWTASRPKEAQLAVLSSKLSSHVLTIKPDFPTPMESVNASKNFYLRYKCTLSTSDFQEANLAVGSKKERTFCQEATIPFKIHKANSRNELILQLFEPSQRTHRSSAPISTFAEALTLQMVWRRVDDGTQMESGRLHVWTLDAWLTIQPLEENAIARWNNTLRQVVKSEIHLLNQDLIRLVKSAPQFLQPLINVGLALSPDSCQNLQVSRSVILANNYYTKLDAWNLDLMRHAQLDEATGKLHFFAPELAQSIKKRAADRQMRACMIISLAGSRDPYDVRRYVEDFSLIVNRTIVAANNSAPCKKTSCQLVGEQRRNLTLLSGLVASHLVCPIVCNSANGVTCMVEFYRNNDSFSAINQTKEWTSFPNSVKIAPGGHVIELPRRLSQQHHGGDYMCKAGGVTAHLHVRVVVPPKWLRKPPGLVLVVMGDSVSLTCEIEVMDSPSSRASVTSEFKASKRSAKQNIQKLKNIDGINMSANLQARDSYFCTVQPESAKAHRPELPMYWMRTDSRIVVVPKIRPAIDVTVSSAIHCSWKHLYLIPSLNEHTFKIQPGIIQSLESADVRISGHVTLDGLPLTKTLLRERGWQSALRIEYEQNSGALIFRVDIAATKTKLDLMKVFTEQANEPTGGKFIAVFNYHYPSTNNYADYSAVTYTSKESYNGSDEVCKDDQTCFYSTAFDSYFLAMHNASETANSSSSLLVDITKIVESFKLSPRRLTLLLFVVVLVCAASIVLGVFVWRRFRKNTSSSSFKEPSSPNMNSENNGQREDFYDVLLCVDQTEATAEIVMDTL